MEEIIIHEGVETIGDYCFCEGAVLKYVYLPASINTAGMRIFQFDSQMEKIVVLCTDASFGNYPFNNIFTPTTNTCNIYCDENCSFWNGKYGAKIYNGMKRYELS